MTMQIENKLSLEQILAKLEAKGKKATDETIARIRQNIEQRDLQRELRRGNAARQQAITAFRAVKEFGRGGIVDRTGNEITDVFERAIRLGDPKHFVMFIGGGTKNYGDTHDKQLVERVHALLQTIKANHAPGVKLDLILADEHVVRNGYTDATGEAIAPAHQYMHAMAQDIQTAQQEGIEVNAIQLSELYAAHGLESMTEERALKDADAKKVYWQHMSSLESNARHHSRTGKGEEVDAIRYVAMRMQERVILAESFPHAVLLAPGISTGAQSFILPERHTAIFLGGKSPWFMKGGE